jgi:hypothetical protein
MVSRSGPEPDRPTRSWEPKLRAYGDLLRRRRSIAVISAVLVLAAVALALGAAAYFRDDDEPAVESRSALELVSTTAVEGGSPRERALLGRVVSGMEETTLRRIRIGPVKGRREGDAGPAVPIVFTPVAGPSVRRQWEEWVVSGAFSRRLDAVGLPAEVEASDLYGAFIARPRLRGQPDPRPLSPPQQEAAVRRIRTAARRSGARIASLEVHRPYGPAVGLTLAPEQPARFLETELRPLLDAFNARRGRLEGVYLAVLDEAGRIALEWGSWTRNPAGSYWVRRDLAECSPIEQSEPPGTEPPPPCPE